MKSTRILNSFKSRHQQLAGHLVVEMDESSFLSDIFANGPDYQAYDGLAIEQI